MSPLGSGAGLGRGGRLVLIDDGHVRQSGIGGVRDQGRIGRILDPANLHALVERTVILEGLGGDRRGAGASCAAAGNANAAAASAAAAMAGRTGSR